MCKVFDAAANINGLQIKVASDRTRELANVQFFVEKENPGCGTTEQ